MPAFSNRYYDSTRVTTWADLGSTTWADSDWDWQSFSEPTHSEWTYTTTAFDIGRKTWVVPETFVTSSGSPGDYAVNISYSISDDNITFTPQAAGAFNARYVKVVVTTAKDYITGIQSDYYQNTITYTATDVDTSTLAGSVSARQLPITTMSAITAASFQPDIAETRPLSFAVLDTDPATFSFVSKNLDTWGRVAVDATINITVWGLPSVIINTNSGSVIRSQT